MPPLSVFLNILGFILEAVSQQAIPTMCDTSFFVERGVLASYDPELHEMGRQAARLVDKIIIATFSRMSPCWFSRSL